MDERIASHIFICEDIEERVERLYEELHGMFRCVKFFRDDFKIEDAKAVIAEAYISEENTKYLLLGAKSFNVYAQNALLKILEEPPKNIRFILVASSKSIFLPTIRSRLRIVTQTRKRDFASLDFSLRRFDIATLFETVKRYEHLKSHDLHRFIERLYHQAVFVDRLALNGSQLAAFERALRLVSRNTRAQIILTHLLMEFLPKANRES